ncbi:hypothetical protein [Paenibacillus sp. Soil787]|uniref:hypothetical protein n=1 Tax=Paenibacillus sp. Soil787 TaxID=1736411 RepID=UPI000B243B71|nr:hypothetical protein [Paenibacillus sp. Soil787]
MRNKKKGIIIGYLGLGILAFNLAAMLIMKWKIVLPNEYLMNAFAVLLITLFLWPVVSISAVLSASNHLNKLKVRFLDNEGKDRQDHLRIRNTHKKSISINTTFLVTVCLFIIWFVIFIWHAFLRL